MTTPGRPRFRVVVRSECSEVQRWWFYEVRDTAKPEGRQLKITGVRPTWLSALWYGLRVRRDMELREFAAQRAEDLIIGGERGGPFAGMLAVLDGPR